jgi:hypothetical protein
MKVSVISHTCVLHYNFENNRRQWVSVFKNALVTQKPRLVQLHHSLNVVVL